MNIHYLQHVPFEGLGSIETWGIRRRHALAATRLYRGERLPPVEDVEILVVMGGPMNVYDEARYPWLAEEKRFIDRVIAAGRRVLGICLGAQLVADVLGSRVYPNAEKEIGWFPIEATVGASTNSLLATLPQRLEVFHWHGDTFDIPAGAVHIARSAGCAHQAYVYEERVVGLQFHLETTPASARLLIAHCGEEIVGGRYVQTSKLMLEDPRRFATINRVMHEMLDRFIAATPERDAPTAGSSG